MSDQVIIAEEENFIFVEGDDPEYIVFTEESIEIVSEGVQGPTGPAGPPGPQGIPGAGAGGPIAYRHVQSVASDVWTIDHNLSFYPNVSVVDSAGTVVEGEVAYPTANTVVLTFSTPFGGEAYLS